MSFPPGDHRILLPHGGFQRSYQLHIPPVAGPFPLVVMLHGAGGDAEFAAEETGWSKLADSEGFAVVYPEAVWYGRVGPEDVEEIVERHLIGGEPVERLRIRYDRPARAEGP